MAGYAFCIYKSAGLRPRPVFLTKKVKIKMARAGIKDKLLNIRSTQSMVDDLKIAAEKESKTQSQLIRQFVEAGLSGDIKIKDFTPLVSDLHALSTNLARVGGNLNHVAHHFNMTNEVDEELLELIFKALRNQFKDISEKVHEVKNGLV